ncbi:kinase-like domain-containing protein [Ilyonectria destructans]|nr:kinase-like domain-containing protein [Ilyonectria destructans]
MTENRVRMILDQCELGVDDSEKADTAQTICGMPSSKTDIDFTSYRKVFTILILMEKHDQILHFIKEQLHDSLLPLQSIGDRDNIHHIGLPNSSVLHPCFQSWSIKSIKDFGTYQLKLSAPFFKDYGDECRHYFFPKNVALPFIPVRRKEFEGAFSSVTKVRLPKHHGNLRLHTQKRGKDQIFAIKRLFSTDRKPFQIEASVLGRLNSIGHEHNTKHIAKLLATFEVDSKRGPTFYFIFPCADHNLMEFWCTYTPHQDAALRQRISNWMARQLNGLAHALQILHEFADFRAPSDKDPRRFGIHGDIKPQNILCFRNWNGEEDEFGFLQLADFGLAQYHKSISVNRVSSRKTWHKYAPPETGLDWPTGRPLDIWAMGCLFIEFTVWLNFGLPGLFEFNNERQAISLVLDIMRTNTFYDCYSLPRWCFGECVEVSIAQGVLNWAMKVHDAPHTPKFIHDLVDLTVQDMLVPNEREQDKAGAISKMCERLYLRRLVGKPRLPTDRIVISDLVKKLDNMIERDVAYFEQPFQYDKSSFSWPPPIIARRSGAELNVRSRSWAAKNRQPYDPVNLERSLREAEAFKWTMRVGTPASSSSEIGEVR